MKWGSHTPRAPRTRRCGWGLRIPSEANCNQRARLCVFPALGQSDDEREHLGEALRAVTRTSLALGNAVG
jgi:hypothetical protein